jgi:hypothetical protein
MWIGAVCGVLDANMFPEGFDTRYSVCNDERKIISWDNARDVNSVSISGDTVLFISIFPLSTKENYATQFPVLESQHFTLPSPPQLQALSSSVHQPFTLAACPSTFLTISPEADSMT